MRYLVLFLAVAAVAGFGWVFSLPDKQECVASGRTVDPTERHCLSGDDYQQLEEHALFHSREVVLGTLLLVWIGLGVRRYVMRRRARSEVQT
jgi:hypothetical protein